MEDVYQGSNGRTAVGTLEGQLAGGQGRHQAVTFISAQAVVEFDGACLMHTRIRGICMKISV